jgi:hypothetical protein
MSSNVVYHASTTGGLSVIEPRESTHKQKWIYATKDIVTSAMFLGENSDFICQTGVEGTKPYIFERFSGALEHAYSKKKGSVYVLNGENFKSGQTSWSAEIVSEKPEVIAKEIIVDDALEFLFRLEKDKKLEIYRYPNRPASALRGKDDIIEKAAEWTIDFGDSILDQVKKYHPDILPEVTRRIELKLLKPNV